MPAIRDFEAAQLLAYIAKIHSYLVRFIPPIVSLGVTGSGNAQTGALKAA
jgi:hypothetical protein